MRAAGNTGSLPVWRAETSDLKSALDTLFFLKPQKAVLLFSCLLRVVIHLLVYFVPFQNRRRAPSGGQTT